MRIYLIRHAQSELNAKNILQGSMDSELTDKGQSQAQLIGRHLAQENIATIITSPAVRAHATATVIRNKIHVPLVLEKDLRECHFGDFEGRNKDTLVKENRELMASWQRNPLKLNIPNMEPLIQFYARAEQVFDRIVADAREADIAIVTHAGVIGAVLCHVIDRDLNRITQRMPGNGSISIIEKQANAFNVVIYDDRKHLSDTG